MEKKKYIPSTHFIKQSEGISMEVSTTPLRSMVIYKREDTGAAEGGDAADAVALSFWATLSPFQAPPPLLAVAAHI